MYRKCTVNVICPWSWKCAGHVKFLILQEMYGKFHVSLLGIVNEMRNFWHHWKCAGNIMFPCPGNVHEMWNFEFHKLRKMCLPVPGDIPNYNSFCPGNFTLNFLDISCSLLDQEIWLFSSEASTTHFTWVIIHHSINFTPI